MSKLLAVFGATGVQGGSVISHVLNTPSLAQEYKIRALVRDLNSPKALQLKSFGVELVQADILDPSSLPTALKDVHTVFALTIPFSPTGPNDEFQMAKSVADIAIQQKVSYLIFSTLPAVTGLSGGKYDQVTAFDNKARAEAYIRTLPIKSAFVSLGFFMENWETQPYLSPKRSTKDNGTWVLSRPVSGKVRLPYLAAAADAGKFVGAILSEPEKYEGKRFCAAAEMYSLEDIAAIMSKTSGKKVVYEQVDLDVFRTSLPFLPDLFAQGYLFAEEFGGYFGPESEDAVAWGVKQVGGKLTTLEEFFEKNPLKLE